MNKLNVYEIKINLDDDKTGVDEIALTATPAILVKGLTFNQSEPKNYKFNYNKEQQIIAGAAMIPDLLIDRYDDNDELYQVFFSKETIKNIVYKFMLNNNNKAFNFEHQKRKVDAVLFESWIVSDNDKSKEYGFNLPVGSWFIIIKIIDAEFWNEYVKNGVDGFSVEGYFIEQFIKELKYNKENTPDEIEKFIDELTEDEKQVFSDLIDSEFDDFIDSVFVDYVVTLGSSIDDELNNDEFELIEVDEDDEDNKETFATALNSTEDDKSFIDKGLYKIRYIYKGNIKSNSREFCKKMISANRVYRYEDLQQANQIAYNAGFGIKGADTYDILRYKGGVNCKHIWQRVIFFRKKERGRFLPNNGLNNDKRITVNEATKAGLQLNVQPNEVSIKPYNMPNNGRYI